ncbi:beta-aspartyl-peptidase [Fictibacillus phosphorivorans]|uniref:beta-aspartyl-peptidase n=1 Tax=Fictibacillus phosphorivorans TaxID=1221500 RepID=UPI00203B7C13|nr:beta-aspartyl-peptidase [Fictibacillus phosphorivorans]MCM3718629.1 beta-aspartyl-peptidase [Fictibacillus phosphorivorans]MCM3776252.1 beta-aspartyl-peptidase [Fictibacillus phosphorivorans]
MITLIKGGEVYAPHHLGKKDILIAAGKIAKISDHIEWPVSDIDIHMIDATGKIVAPGFIDAHVHITGGGGEGGYKTRTPEIYLSDITLAGVTTVVGVIGTDGTARTMTNLIGKAKALKEEGISCFVHTGSYQVPVKTLTGSIETDIMMIDEVIGVGEIAISDHRSSQPNAHELARLASQARVAGMLSGKAGVVNIHLGDSKRMLSLIEEVIETTDLPISQFYPTHINRNSYVFEAGIEYAKKGGYVDFTTSTTKQFIEEGEVKCSTGLKRMLEAGVPIERITFTSDAQGSLPAFNEHGEFTGLRIGKVNSLYKEIRDAVVHEGIPLQTALQTITSNPAKILKLKEKGILAEGLHADLVLLNKDNLNIDTVIALGQVMVQSGRAVIKGTFE